MAELTDNGFRGSGWHFPIELADDGTVRRSGDAEQTVHASLWAILSTSPGERVMRPDFGCGLDDHVFDLNGPATAATLAATVRACLQEWESRIEVLDVAVAPDPAEPARLLIVVDYLLRSSNGRANLVYPFYLERGSA